MSLIKKFNNSKTLTKFIIFEENGGTLKTPMTSSPYPRTKHFASEVYHFSIIQHTIITIAIIIKKIVAPTLL